LKTLIVYFSRSGHTQQLATELAQRCGGTLEAIAEMRPSQGLWGWLRAGWNATWRRQTAIAPTRQRPTDFDLVLVGTPIWNYRLSPPVRSYLQQHGHSLPRVAFFCTEGGAGEKNAFDEMTQLCGQPPLATLAVTEQQLPPAAHLQSLVRFCQQTGLTLA
jgi:flavodoxin